MADLIDRQAALDATWKAPSYTDPLNVLTEVRDRIAALPSVQPEYMLRINQGSIEWLRRDNAVRQMYAEFINWLLDEVWDDEMWELNYRAFPELLCRRLAKAGWLKEEGGRYVRLD